MYEWTAVGCRPVAKAIGAEDTFRTIGKDRLLTESVAHWNLQEAMWSEDLRTFISSSGSRQYLLRTISVPMRWPGRSSCQICQFLSERASAHQRHGTLEMELEQCATSRNDVPSTGLLRLASAADTPEYLNWDMLATFLNPGHSQIDIRHLVSPEVDWEMVRRLIGECQTSHGVPCSLMSSGRLQNLKVIDCKRRIIVPAPASCRFVALSYVWGQSTGESSFSLEDEVPRTIEDSIRVTLRLNFEYIWIDRYVSPAKLVSFESMSIKHCSLYII